MLIGDYVYRAVSGESWIRRGQPKAPAFRRRWKYDAEGKLRECWDEDGLSLGTSPEEACRQLTTNYGVLKLSVEKLRMRGFEFDDPVEGHVCIINMPFYREEDRDEAAQKALLLLECVEEVLPPEPSPSA